MVWEYNLGSSLYINICSKATVVRCTNSEQGLRGFTRVAHRKHRKQPCTYQPVETLTHGTTPFHTPKHTCIRTYVHTLTVRPSGILAQFSGVERDAFTWKRIFGGLLPGVAQSAASGGVPERGCGRDGVLWRSEGERRRIAALPTDRVMNGFPHVNPLDDKRAQPTTHTHTHSVENDIACTGPNFTAIIHFV